MTKTETSSVTERMFNMSVLHIDKKLEGYLKGGIDFDSFHLVAAVPVNDVYAVMFLAPKSSCVPGYFNVRYGELTSKHFKSIEKCTDWAVENGLITKLQASSINNRYYTVYGGNGS